MRTSSRRIFGVFSLILVLGLTASPSLMGQANTALVPSNSDIAQKLQQPVPVYLDGKVVIEIQWRVGNMTPQLRAEGISQRLKKLADQHSSQPITTTTNPLSVDVWSGDVLIASVFNGDAQAVRTSREDLAQRWGKSFDRAMSDYRHNHSRAKTIERWSLASLVLVITLAILWSLILLSRWSLKWTSQWIFSRMTHSRRRSLSLIDTEQIERLLRLAFSVLRWSLSLVVIYVAFQLLFLLFPLTRPFGQRMLDGVTQPLRQFAMAAWDSLPSLIFILIIVLACRYLISLITFAFTRIGEGKVRIEGFRPQWATVTSRLISLALILLAILIAYPYIPGSQSAAFKGLSLFLGVLVSLGSTGVVANVFNGVVLTYVDSFQVGDYIQIGDTQGYVESTSLFVTRLRTRQSRVITIPNAQVLSSQITNYSEHDGAYHTLSVTAGIGYDAPWRQVEAMMLNAAHATRTVMETPAPFVIELSLNTFDITYELTVFLSGEAPIAAIRSELHRNILDQFNKYGVQIMTPAYEGDPERPAVVPPDKWYAAPATPPEVQVPPK